MKDSADPLTSWPLAEVLDTSSGPATADVYGKLLFYLRGQLHSFLNRISNSKISFEILHFGPTHLPGRVPKASFSRIEVSGHPTITNARYRMKKIPTPEYFATLLGSIINSS